MNALVEKMFGVIMFLAIFVPFQLGMYNSYMSALEFTQVSTEYVQLLKEHGGHNGMAQDYGEMIVNNHGYDIQLNAANSNEFDFGEVVTVRIANNSERGFGWQPNLEKTVRLTNYIRH